MISPKEKQKLDAKRRAQLAATAQPAPAPQPMALYQTPQINVPANLHEAAKLIQTELEKIATAQSAALEMRDGSQVVSTDHGGRVEMSDSTDKTYIDITAPGDAKKEIDFTGRWIAWDNGTVEYISRTGVITVHTADARRLHGEVRQYWLDGNYNPQNTNIVSGLVDHVALLDYAIRQDGEGGGTFYGSDMNTAPANTTIFAYGSATNNGISEMVLADFGALGGGYKLQLGGIYSQNKLMLRTRNGDSGNWGAWTNTHAHYGGGTAGTDWNSFAFYLDPYNQGASGYMEVRQYDDGNGMGANSPGYGYGVALFYGAGGFSQQLVINDQTGVIAVRGGYAGQTRPWFAHHPTAIVKKQIYTELLQAGILTPEQHTKLTKET